MRKLNVVRRSDSHEEAVPAEMSAVVYRGAHCMTLETVPVPEIKEREILVRVRACGVCGTDLKKIQMGLVEPPRIFGHEFAGTVVRTGTSVARFAPGDRVAVYHHVPCRRCFYCRKKLFSQCEHYRRTGTTAGFEPSGGGFAAYVRVMDWVVEEGRLPSRTASASKKPVSRCL